jgi:hypothetical protein
MKTQDAIRTCKGLCVSLADGKVVIRDGEGWLDGNHQEAISRKLNDFLPVIRKAVVAAARQADIKGMGKKTAAINAEAAEMEKAYKAFNESLPAELQDPAPKEAPKGDDSQDDRFGSV